MVLEVKVRVGVRVDVKRLGDVGRRAGVRVDMKRLEGK